MKKFYREVNVGNRREMEAFLGNHFRYYTAKGWNLATSYANNMKVYNLGLPDDTESRLFDLMECEGFYSSFNGLIQDFAADHDYRWQAGFNGRSGGYLVLYEGGQKPSGYKSYCTNCGQMNYRSVKETGCKCGRCGTDARVDYIHPPMDTFAYPGIGTDQYADFSSWEETELRDRVALVQEFDHLCDGIVALAVEMAGTYEIAEETVYVPATVKRMVRV